MALRLGIVQHLLRDEPSADAFALAAELERAVVAGADIIVVPALSALTGNERMRVLVRGLGPRCLVASGDPDGAAPVEAAEGLGRVGIAGGDAALAPESAEAFAAAGADTLLLAPGCESELQAAAALEYAVGLSRSVAGLVVVAEAAGAPPGQPGHGGSAIVLLGEILAEGGTGADVLVADVPVPVPRSEVPAPVPAPAPILAQRLAVHAGRRVEPGYPADTS